MGRSAMSKKALMSQPTSQLDGAGDGKVLDYREQYIRVKEQVNQLNSRIDDQIAKNDSEFLAAYRSHMQQVQKELEAMKKKMNECEFIIKKDERVRKLQAQISWFRDEALFLSK